MKFESILNTQSYLNSYLNISRTFNINLRILLIYRITFLFSIKILRFFLNYKIKYKLLDKKEIF